MRNILIIMALLGGGYYYLINYHFASRSNKFLDNYQTDDKNSSKEDDDFEIDMSQFEEKAPSEKKKAVEYDREVKIFYGINDSENQTYKCDGRKRCTQMHSCEEATFFQKNCPGVLMDQDGDGIPCEDQWCMKGVY